MLVVGLTGGIGSGKSTVANLFAQLGTPVIDTDELAREVVALGSPALASITDRFGAAILHPDGNLNRAALRIQIFQFPSHRAWLETLLHPLIREESRKIMRQLKAPYCLISIPLLFETRPHSFFQRILVVDTPEYLQISRTCQRDNTPKEQTLSILKSQVTRRHRLMGADEVIYNDLDIEHLTAQVNRLHQKFLTNSL